jgi:F420-dependent oxidoreductase-like protein
MKIGLQIGSYAWSGGPAAIGETLGELVGTADAYGFDIIGVGDHLWQVDAMGGPEQPQMESLTTLGAIAARTRRTRLVPLVLAAPYRAPAIIAKSITSLDVLSSGRAMLGIGAGWYEAEARGLGLPFPSLADRFAILEETIEVCLRMWSGERGDEQPFAGRHVSLQRALNVPQSLSRPHPPILIGGSGERKTLRLVARYAVACSFYPTPDLAHKIDVLRRWCEEEGRDYDSIEKTCMYHFAVGDKGEKAGDLIGALRGLASQGIETVIGIASGPEPVRVVEIVVREIVPAVADA